MRRILVWRKPAEGSDIGIFHKTDYRDIYAKTLSYYGYTNGINFGNKVWYQGICSAISQPDNYITYGTNESAEEINDHYDLIIYPMANFFGEKFCHDTTQLADSFSKITIPVYIIACGAQAASYDHLDDLISKISDPARRFIDSIYHTGGEFALRGYFTKEFFNRLGYSTPVVTGCPSLYQVGPDLKIEKKTTCPGKPVINGKIKAFEQILRRMPDSVFLAQDSFFDCLYNGNYFQKASLKKDLSFVRSYGVYPAELLAEGRIRLFPDTADWYGFLRASGFDYSFGTKIHGSIMPILAGIPATVVSIDSRTKEMAEFFEIPYLPFRDGYTYSEEDLYAAYEEADYSRFNESFSQKYHAFEQFLTDKGIVDKIQTKNEFFKDTGENHNLDYLPNQLRFRQYASKLKREEPLLRLGGWFLDLK